MAIAVSVVGGETYGARVVRDGAVGYWRLDELAGTFVDALGGPVGTASGTIVRGQASAFADGRPAVLFDGATGFVSVPDTPAHNPGLGSYTIEVWVKRGPSNPLEFLLCKSFGGGSAGSGGEVQLTVNGAFASRLGAKTVVSAIGFANAAWHHVVIVMNRAVANGGRVYVDGVASGAAVDLTSEAAINLSGTGLPLLLGKRTTGNFYGGTLDEVAIYNTALTAEQVAAHYGLRTALPSGVRVGGAATMRRGVSQVATGGVRIGSATIVRRGIGVTSAGGVRVSGLAMVRRGVSRVGTGGVRVGGTALVYAEHFHADSSEIDGALVATLLADAPLLALLPDGVYIDEAPPGRTRFVIVSLIEEHDEPMFAGRAFEDGLYLVKAVALGTSGTAVKAAAKRIDTLLEDGTLAIPGYTLMTLHREARIRLTEVDDQDSTIRWQHRGGHYRLQASPQ